MKKEEKEKKVLSAKEIGRNTLTIVSMNPDHLQTEQVQNDITNQLENNKVHIALIQETHIPQDRNFIKITTG